MHIQNMIVHLLHVAAPAAKLANMSCAACTHHHKFTWPCESCAMQHALFTAEMISLYLALLSHSVSPQNDLACIVFENTFLHETTSFPETSLLAGNVPQCPAVQSELISFACNSP